MIRIRHLKLAAILLTLPVLLTACDAAGPVTTKSAQAVSNKTFASLRTTIAKADTLAVKSHQGPKYTLGDCSGSERSFTDTSAVYVSKSFDQGSYLKKLQTKLNGEGYQTSLGVTGGYNTLMMSKDGYNYQALATTKVNDSTIATNKAILFVATSPCLDPDA